MQYSGAYQSTPTEDHIERSWSSPRSMTGASESGAVSSSSSLAFALDENAIRTHRMNGWEALPPSQSPTLSYDNSDSVFGFGSPQSPENEYSCGATSSYPEFSVSAASWLPNGAIFAEVTYEEEYATAFDKRSPTQPDGYKATSPCHEITNPNSLVIEPVAGVDYFDPYSPASPNDYGYDFRLSPFQDEPMVMPSPPTAAQISRSSTLANAMTLPPALRTPRLPPTPPPSISALVEFAVKTEQNPSTLILHAVLPTVVPEPESSVASPVQSDRKAEGSAVDASTPTPITPTVAPETRVDTTLKKRSYKTGRPRGRPPKNPLTSIPRDKVLHASTGEASPAAPTVHGGSDGAQSQPASSDDILVNTGGEHPGQSSFMLDSAVPEPPKKKPIMACLFCRERKIGCGPPPPEQEDQTCKQCKRRGLICEWPTECRRGQHKRGPRKKRDLPEDIEMLEGVANAAASSSAASKSKLKPKLVADDLERRKTTTDIHAVVQRQTAMKRQRKLAAAQHKRLLEMRMVPE